MKTLRLFGVALMAIVLSSSLTACSSDDDGDESSSGITGIWEVPEDDEIMVLEKDGSYRYYTGYDDPKTRGNEPNPYIEIEFGTYVLTDNTITFNPNKKYTYYQNTDELTWYNTKLFQETWEYSLVDGKLNVKTEYNSFYFVRKSSNKYGYVDELFE